MELIPPPMLLLEVPQDYYASSAMPCLFIHFIYVIHYLYIRSLSVMLSRISFHVLYGREAFEITPINQAHQFVSPSSCEAIIVFVNELGCTLRIYNIHQRSAYPFHLAEEDFRLGNLKFVSKSKADEVFGMPIPNELISKNIRNAPYYNAYLEMVVKHDQKIAAEKEGKMKTASAKQPKSKPAIEKSSKPAFAPKPKETKERPFKASTAKPPKPKPAKEKSTKTTPPKQAGKGKIGKVHKVQSQSHVGSMAVREPVAEATQPLLIVEGKAIKVSSSRPFAQAQDDTSTNIVCDIPSLADAETGAAYEKTNSGADEHVILEDPISSIEALSSMKNLEDAHVIEDQFINDKSTKDELENRNVEAEVVSMVIVPIYQASSTVPSVSTSVPVMDLSPPKPAELPKADMKEILHEHMFETGTYKSLPEHVALYEALKAFMERANKDENLTKKDKSRKRRRDDQDPPPPPPDSDLS
nr:histone deacetylase 14 [Tanacetum cinerariifolium]